MVQMSDPTLENAETPEALDSPETAETSVAPANASAWRIPLIAGVMIAVLVGLIYFMMRPGSGVDPDSVTETTGTVGAAMAGAVVDVNVSEEALASQPEGMDLSTPEAAVRAYLDWTSYAYRIAQSRVALPTMSTYQEVRVDSYVQYNIQQGRLLDQTLTELAFGEPREDAERVHVPVRETWEYSYVSIERAGEVVSGPHTVSYDATYTVIPQGDDWVVNEVKATALGPVE